ncbi:MAG: hypothetical protein PHO65_03125 [Sulfurovum sp.]|nr:hypothetical protein [Sulfurovum sp.]
MAYIESFFLFWLLVIGGGIILVSFIWLTMMFIKGIIRLKQKKESAFFETGKTKKILKTFTVVYLISMVFFYGDRVNDYLIGDRPYKEAKSYAIAGDYLLLWKTAVLSVVYPNHALYKPFDAVYTYILKKMYEYIPKSDAEREIWNYKFNLMAYARTMYAPVSDEDLKKGIEFTNPSASMKPDILSIMNSIYNSMDVLYKETIKDQEFERIDKYLVTSAMAPYFIMYLPYMAQLETDWQHSGYNIQKRNIIYKTPEYRAKLLNYLAILDNVHEALSKDKVLAKAFEAQPRLKVAYYWGATFGYENLYGMEERLDNVYPCHNPSFLKFVENYKEYVHWAYMTPGGSFKHLSKREQKKYSFLIEAKNNSYHIAKYICKIPFQYMTREEQSIPEKYREFNMIRSAEEQFNIKHIREIEQNLTKVNKH